VYRASPKSQAVFAILAHVAVTLSIVAGSIDAFQKYNFCFELCV
jgi:hypothetical protein